MKGFHSAVIAVIAAFSIPAIAGTLAEDVTLNLQAMKGSYSADYAPAAWKKTWAGYDLDIEYAHAIASVQSDANLSMARARAIFKQFIYAMKDYHVSVSFMATETAKLPIIVAGTPERFFLVWIDRTKLTKESFPYEVGDELVTFAGKPVEEVISGLQAEINSANSNVPGTDRALAALRLTARAASRGMKVPHGPITLGIKVKGASTVSQIQLVWEHTPESIKPRGFTEHFELNESSIFNPRMDVDVSDRKSTDVETPFDMGARKSFIPDLGKKIWESADDAIFHAYIYQTTDRKLIGYVRIPSYSKGDLLKSAAEFAKLIARLEASTDSLVIDQVNNPGGSVFYLYALASMLTDRPLIAPRHRMAINQGDVLKSLETIEKLKGVKNDEDAKKALPASELSGYPSSYEFVQFTLNQARFIIDEWNKGKAITAPYWIAGVDHINPAPVHYTKPILLLVNHLDFSGGDFFPTILQDAKRVTILGSRTAGAGGYVRDVKVRNNVGIAAYRITGSIAERVTGHPIENLGVTPDIIYNMTAEDYQNGFVPYVREIQAAVKKITP